MIDIHDEKDCVGCNACAQICPVKCISTYHNPLGFEYPKADAERCINCHLCERVCPVINQAVPRRPLRVYAAKNPNEEIRLHSSSGGVFTALAERVINDGGVVFGAKFDCDFNVKHDYTENIEGLREFQGSKYVQSEIGDSFALVERFIKAGRRVMFTGTPCQLSGLRLFLRKDYGDSLISVDVVCHGVPGPAVWQAYLRNLTESLNVSLDEVSRISFRDKKIGWRRFGFALDYSSHFFQPLDENLYIQIFLKNFDLRPSCYSCPAKCGKSHSDITLADFWKLRKFHTDFFDEKGVSLLMINTKAGLDLVEHMDLELTLSSYENGLYGNPSIEKSASIPSERDSFIKLFLMKDWEGIAQLLHKNDKG